MGGLEPDISEYIYWGVSSHSKRTESKSNRLYSNSVDPRDGSGSQSRRGRTSSYTRVEHTETCRSADHLSLVFPLVFLSNPYVAPNYSSYSVNVTQDGDD